MISAYLKYKAIKPLQKFFNIKINLICTGFITGIIYYFNPFLAVMVFITLLTLIKRGKFLLLMIFTSLGILYIGNYVQKIDNTPQKNNFSHAGIVIYSPKVNEFDQEIIIKSDEFANYIKVKVEKYLEISQFDQILFEGNIIQIQNQENTTFDSKSYNLSRKVSFEIKDIKILNVSPSNSISQKLSQFKSYLEGKIKQNLPEPHSGLINGILFGSSNSLDSNLKESLKDSGVYHIVSISGFNVSIIYASIFTLSKKILNRRYAIILSLIAILMFMFFIGIENLPVVRATLMTCYGSIAIYFGRNVSIYSALLVSIMIILILYPIYIINLSLLLSSIATLGIMLVSKVQIDTFSLNHIQSQLNEFKTSIAAISSTSLITYTAFKEFNLTGLITNFFILPTIPFLMLFGFILLLSSMLNSYLLTYLLKTLIHQILQVCYQVNEIIALHLKVVSTSITPVILLICSLLFLDYYAFKKNTKYSFNISRAH